MRDCGEFYFHETVYEYITRSIDVDDDIVRIKYDVERICNVHRVLDFFPIDIQIRVDSYVYLKVTVHMTTYHMMSQQKHLCSIIERGV